MMINRKTVYNALICLTLPELQQLSREHGYLSSDKLSMSKKALINKLLKIPKYQTEFVPGGGRDPLNEFNLLHFWGYQDSNESMIGKSDPARLPFDVNDEMKKDMQAIINQIESGPQRTDTWMGPDDLTITVPKGTRLLHGTWIPNPKHPITDYHFPAKEYTHFGLYPVISAFILLETLKNYNWQHGTEIPVIIVSEVTQSIKLTYTSVGSCDGFIDYLEPKPTMSGFGITATPRYSDKNSCAFNETVKHWGTANYEICLHKSDMKWTKPTHYAIVDFNKLMKNCGDPKFDVLEAIFSPEKF